MYYFRLKRKYVQFIFAILLSLTILVGCTSPQNVPPATEPSAVYSFNYDLEGYLFKQNDDGRVFVENANFTARDPSWPKELKAEETNSDKTTFEYVSLRCFPSIDNDTGLSTYTYDKGNGLLEVHVAKPGGIRDKETGEAKLVIEVEYIMFIDKDTKDLLLCQIWAQMDGENQQYFFSPTNDLDYINDIMIRGYTG